MNKQKIKRLLVFFFQMFLVVIVSVLVAILLRVFLFASFKIPSVSMFPAIDAGDYILVNKLIPGPRVYKNFDFLKGGKVETRRFKGVRAVRRNDVLVFNFPHVHGWNKIEMNPGVSYVKRCVALPGDTFYIENAIYKVKNIPDSLGCLSHQRQLSLKKESEILPGIYNSFPYDSVYYKWNIKNFGPLYIPRAGDVLAINSVNYRLYKKPIEYETGKDLRVVDNRIYLDDELMNTYLFKQNYYFMSGDLVGDSKDSRYWGLLPEDHIIGKAWLIWKSKDPATGKYRWKRFFKIIK